MNDRSGWCQNAQEYFDEANWNALSPAECWALRFTLVLDQVQLFLRSGKKEGLQSLRDAIQSLQTDASLNMATVRGSVEYLRRTQADLCMMERFPDGEAKWKNEVLPANVRRIPVMASEVEMKYVKWLAANYRGTGKVVELGCWLGAVSCCLAAGIAEGRCDGNEMVYCYDAFVWHEWMRRHCRIEGEALNEFQHGESFLEAFRRNTAPYRRMVQVMRGAVCNEEGVFGDAADAVWGGGPIGILINDFWDDPMVSEGVWREFAPWFVPGETIIVLCQYGNPRAEMLREFCRNRSDQLEPLHRLPGAAASFLYVG